MRFEDLTKKELAEIGEAKDLLIEMLDLSMRLCDKLKPYEELAFPGYGGGELIKYELIDNDGLGPEFQLWLAYWISNLEYISSAGFLDEVPEEDACREPIGFKEV